jgi:MinD superfamily P-loop ATPase
MLTIVYTPTGTVVSTHAYLKDAEAALVVVETTPPSHEITGEPEPTPEVEEIG